MRNVEVPTSVKRKTITWVFVVAFALVCRLVAAQAAFHAVGYLTVVDPQNQRLVCTSAGSTYMVDTTHAQIHLLADLGTTPSIGDLVVGMRVQLSGVTADSKIVAASDVQVLPYVPPAGGSVPAVENQGSNVEDSLLTIPMVTGKMTSEATFLSRSIKVAVNGDTIDVTVPRGIPIKLNGRDASVHDLKSGMILKMMGSYSDLRSFDASSITADGG